MDKQGKLVRCSNCKSVFVDFDFEKHKCMRLDSRKHLVEISGKGRRPIELKESTPP